MAFKATQYT